MRVIYIIFISVIYLILDWLLFIFMIFWLFKLPDDFYYFSAPRINHNGKKIKKYSNKFGFYKILT